MKKIIFILLILFQTSHIQCSNKNTLGRTSVAIRASYAGKPAVTPITGAQQLDLLLPKLAGKRVALVVNHTATIGRVHLADTLQKLHVDLKKIFAPEHGFRGNADAGETLKDGVDVKTNLPVVSLYGSTKKPTPDQLADVDILIFDIQDVGVRFYTYISTLHYVMEACAENGRKLIVLDRPNPNGNYIDGPVLKPEFKSFVGMHPIPIVHGLTVGEFAQMINGEGWLGKRITCSLDVIPVKNWIHQDSYSLPIKPSPNLPDDQSVRLYPSLGLFEGTVISVGRGTKTPFEIIGNPELKDQPFSFTPVSIEGMAKNPPFENTLCYGLDLRTAIVKKGQIDLSYLIKMYQAYPDKEKFFISFFDKLAGTDALKTQIKEGKSDAQIRATWQKDLDAFKAKRQQYLIYK